MSGLRFRVVSEAFNKKALQVNPPTENISEYYGRYVFGRKDMAKFLSKGCMQILVKAIDQGETLDREIADEVAEGMKQWAMKHGATHYTHWFQPLTEGTADMHV